MIPASQSRIDPVVTYRHTIRAISILYTLEPESLHVRRFVEWLVDHGDEAQTSDGGWRQCKTEFRDEDLWASTYAMKLLGQIIASPPTWLAALAIGDIDRRLKKTSDRMVQLWNDDRWAYGSARSQDNVPVVLAELASALRIHNGLTADAVTSWLLAGLTPNYHPGDGLLDNDSIAGPAGTTTRLAYALLRSKSDADAFEPEIQALTGFARHQTDANLDSAEAAMLLALQSAAQP